jgi:two-component system sensor kinase FixL
MSGIDAVPDDNRNPPGGLGVLRAQLPGAAATSHSAEARPGAPGEPAAGAPPLQRLFDRPLLLAALFCSAYLAVNAGTALFAVAPNNWTPWNPQAALALTLVATAGLRAVPIVVVAVLLAQLLVRDAPTGIGALVSGLFAAGAYSAAGYAIQRLTRWTRAEITMRDLSALVLIAFTASLAVALLLGLTNALAGTVSLRLLHVVSLQVVVGEALGMITAAPALLLLASGAWRIEAANAAGRGRLGRDLVLFAFALAALLLLIFWWRPFDQFRMSYLLFLPVIAIATRHGLFGTVLALPLVQLGLMAAVSVFAPRVATAFEYQMLTLVMALTCMYLGLLSSERERAAQRLATRERELREQRTALSEIQRAAATAELSAALAHDLNQPLSAIGTYARAARLLAERDDGDRARLFRALDQIAGESARAGQYVRRLRDFFRTGAMHSEQVPVEDLVERGRAHLRDRLERDGIAFETSIAPRLPPLWTDAVQVGAVLDNLLGNACDSLAQADPPRRIRVLAARLDGAPRARLRISVQDNGPGVPEELRPQLFKPLATSKPHGMGLGLALSRSIAERLGGGLSFDASASVTTFHLDLPIHEHRPE